MPEIKEFVWDGKNGKEVMLKGLLTAIENEEWERVKRIASMIREDVGF